MFKKDIRDKFSVLLPLLMIGAFYIYTITYGVCGAPGNC